ncbi:MAG: radical SAM protein [Candidatus Brocadiales bacterium]
MRILLLSMPDMAPQLNTWKAPSLAISSITANMLASQPEHEVYMADLITARDDPVGTIQGLLKDFNPEVVGFSAKSFEFSTACRIATYIKSLHKDVKTVLGGYHSTLMYEDIAREGLAEPFDFLLRGECDHSFGELIQVITDKRRSTSVRGLSFRDNGHWIHNAPRLQEDLNTIVMPNRANRLLTGYTFQDRMLDTLETSRGCTMPCNFCSMRYMYGSTFRTYPLERVMADIANAKKRGTKYLAITDDNICLDLKHLESLCDAIIREGHDDMTYVIQGSSAGISSSETVVEKMSRAGFDMVYLGIENVSEKNLKLMKKGNIVEKTKRAVELLQKYNIISIGGLIIGHPDDREEDIAVNYEFLNRLGVDFYHDQIITPYPKTGMREDLLRQGLITNLDDYRKYSGFWANVKTKHLDSQDIQFYKWKYGQKMTSFFRSPRAYKRRFPTGLLIKFLLKYLATAPYYQTKKFINNYGKTERERFQVYIDIQEHLNDFPELPEAITAEPTTKSRSA